MAIFNSKLLVHQRVIIADLRIASLKFRERSQHLSVSEGASPFFATHGSEPLDGMPGLGKTAPAMYTIKESNVTWVFLRRCRVLVPIS
eukprot:s5144_g3.t1